MKSNIHPKWYDDAKVTCACGNTFATGYSEPKLQVDICSACHPFYTGEMKFVDVQGRVEKFQAKLKAAKEAQKVAKSRKAEKVQKEKEREEQQTLKDIMENIKKTSKSTKK